ncbi:MAG: Asp-tRNA(Asn)/Glu-tRNA(Gln) amidotransferase subunit GatB [Eubacterium sp.]|nr:Asp-tRNA(Asn)/Glu-tRNA(Gln) amidotransferase subunit GatB [Eubacterium sp.]
MSKEYEVVIGLEVHVELNTKTKIFCGCSTEFGGAPNTHVCPVCSGMPGSLPVLNREVVNKAISVGLATNCDITRNAKFDRKNYFYPDNPQNYQISQLYYPICRNGHVDIETEDGGKKAVRIHEIHMEEDAGKLIHDPVTDDTYVDFNRSGVPLIEIVSEPDMRSADEVVAYLEKLRETIIYLGASDCKLNEGSMRADVNLSIREKGSEKFGTRTESKNLNSFRAIRRCIENEIGRQIDILEEGGQVVQETRRWDDEKGYSYPMRSKEDAQDYRYFPDPDLVPIVVSDEWIEEIKNAQPEFRDAKKARYKEEYDLPDYDIDQITGSKKMSEIFEGAVAEGADPKKASNWLMVETMRLMKETGIDAESLRFSPKNLAALIKLVDSKEINGGVAKEVFEKAVFSDDLDPVKYVADNNMSTKADSGQLLEVVKKAIEANPKAVEDVRNGKQKAIGAIVGFVMKEMKGKCDPGEVNKLIAEELSK